jgi:flagellar protein FliO/FliZ
MSAPVNAMPAASGMAQTALSLVLVLGAIFALAWLLRRFQGLRPGLGGALSIKAGLQVGARERVLWIRAGDKDLLIGVAAGQVQTLHVFDHPPAAPEGEAQGQPPPSFVEALRKVMKGGLK